MSLALRPGLTYSAAAQLNLEGDDNVLALIEIMPVALRCGQTPRPGKPWFPTGGQMGGKRAEAGKPEGSPMLVVAPHEGDHINWIITPCDAGG